MVCECRYDGHERQSGGPFAEAKVARSSFHIRSALNRSLKLNMLQIQVENERRIAQKGKHVTERENVQASF